MFYFELSGIESSDFGVREKVIQRVMCKRGYACRIAASKPALSIKNKVKRLDFATDTFTERRRVYEWATTTANRSSQRTASHIHGILSRQPQLQLMQDNAPSHNSRRTMAEFNRRNISTIRWPPFSPDLNPIEHVWKWMKDYIARLYPDLPLGGSRSDSEIKRILAEAWDQGVDENELVKLI